MTCTGYAEIQPLEIVSADHPEVSNPIVALAGSAGASPPSPFQILPRPLRHCLQGLIRSAFSPAPRPAAGRKVVRIPRAVSSGLVRAAGIEPALCRQNWILSPARLPVPPRPHEAASSSHSSCGATLLRLSIAPICHNPERQVQRNPAHGTLVWR